MGLYDTARSCYASSMSVNLYVGLISFAGVLLGGAITFWIQRFTLRSAERAEVRRQEFTLTEAR